MLSVAIVKGTAWVSISIILAVDHSALDSFLNLMRGNEKKSFKPRHKKTRKSTFQRRWLSYVNAPPPYLSAKDAMNHDDDETLQRVEDGKQDLEEGGAAVSDGQDRRHPGEGQQGQNHTGAPQRCPGGLENRLDATDCLRHQTHHYYLCNNMIHKTYPALSFSFTSVMPSLETSLLKTRIPITIFTCSWDKMENEAKQ